MQAVTIIDTEVEILKMERERPFRVRDIVRINGKQVDVRVVQAMPGMRLDLESK